MPSSKSGLNRRTLIKTGLSSLVALGAKLEASTDDAKDLAEAAHQEIWKRFVDPRFDVLLHYAGLNGELILPTAEQCRNAQPNGMSWSTPIEDGPFFGGLYL